MKKLVRDLIPNIIPEDKLKHYEFAQVDESSYRQFLNEKLLEEVKEYIEAENIEELADIYEVIDAILKLNNFNKNEIISLQSAKRDARGGFESRIVMEHKAC